MLIGHRFCRALGGDRFEVQLAGGAVGRICWSEIQVGFKDVLGGQAHRGNTVEILVCHRLGWAAARIGIRNQAVTAETDLFFGGFPSRRVERPLETPDAAVVVAELVGGGGVHEYRGLVQQCVMALGTVAVDRAAVAHEPGRHIVLVPRAGVLRLGDGRRHVGGIVILAPGTILCLGRVVATDADAAVAGFDVILVAVAAGRGRRHGDIGPQVCGSSHAVGTVQVVAEDAVINVAHGAAPGIDVDAVGGAAVWGEQWITG